MKIINLQISNLRKIKAAFFQFSTKGGVTQIVGGNQQAKSTVLDAIMIAFFGPKYMENGATTKGEDKTTITCEMDNGYVIKRVFTEKTDRIELNRIIDGKMYPESSPQAFLDGITNVIAIRPIAFINKSAAEKSKLIADCLNINDKLEASGREIKDYEESRAEIGRTIKEFGKLKEPIADLESKSVKEIQERIDAAVNANQRTREIKAAEIREYELEKKEYEEKENKKEHLRLSVEEFKTRLATMANTVAGVVPELDAVYAKMILDLESHLNVSKGAYMVMQFLKQAPVPLDEKKLIDVDPIKKEMETVAEHNMQVLANNKLKEDIAKLAKEQKRYDNTVQHIEKLKTARATMISAAAKNVGFPFDVDIVDNDIQINGIESANWSTSQGLLFALEACRLLNPTLKTICIDNAEAFDKENRLYVEEWAERNDIQTIMTIVQGPPETDDNTYYIEEGQIKNTPVISDAMESQVPVKEEKEKEVKKKKVILDIPVEEPVAETLVDPTKPYALVPNKNFDNHVPETVAKGVFQTPAVAPDDDDEW